ncbi:hypothetical protein N7535_006642 [Penicillium sp. DV-2018c]|nr:hypothetical protein N7461_007275 [Penicillium sp. DV-2018c]KAJ5567336.1 hypothetical protein N7535_006642 [Penicillium sp. DV-2018c]
MEHLDEELPVLEILRVTRDIFSSLPEGEFWLPGYIGRHLLRLLPADSGLLDLSEFYEITGQDHKFDNAVMEMIIGILSFRLSYMEFEQRRLEFQQQETMNGHISNESHPSGHVAEESEPVSEKSGFVPSECEPVPEECDPLPEEPESVPEEPELSAEGNSGLKTVPREPANVDHWSRVLSLPGDKPNTEMPQEAPDQGHIAGASCSGGLDSV